MVITAGQQMEMTGTKILRTKELIHTIEIGGGVLKIGNEYIGNRLSVRIQHVTRMRAQKTCTDKLPGTGNRLPKQLIHEVCAHVVLRTIKSISWLCTHECV